MERPRRRRTMRDPACRVMSEPPLFLDEVATRNRVGVETLYRWVRRGLVIGTRRVRLEAVKVGRWRTSEAALARFAAALVESQEALVSRVAIVGPADDGD